MHAQLPLLPTDDFEGHMTRMQSQIGGLPVPVLNIRAQIWCLMSILASSGTVVCISTFSPEARGSW